MSSLTSSLPARVSRLAQTCRHSSTLSRTPASQSGSDNRNDSLARRKVIFSGIQPTGIPHLGNYLGALRSWVNLQNTAAPETDLLFSIVGWHALTLPPPPDVLRTARRETLAVLLAIGLDPERVTLFHQDHNPDHAELAWILACLAPVARMRRMTTWKARLSAAHQTAEDELSDEGLNTGLFTYPILQAADILAYRATHVPVGEDQTQHLELARDLASSFDRVHSMPQQFAPLFPLPAMLSTPTRRVLSLRDPTAKMSKSAPDPASRILLSDAPVVITKKLKGAVTDSDPTIYYDPIARPGTSNLLAILGAAKNESPAALGEQYKERGCGHGVLKNEVAEAMVEILDGPRQEYERLRRETGYLEQVEKDGARKARERSAVVLQEVRKRVGLA